MEQPEVVARFDSRVEADLARSLLDDHGIEARVTADDVGGLHPELSLVTGGVGLAVSPQDAAAARELLGARDDTPSEGSGVVRARRRLAAAVVGVAVLVLLVAVADAFLQGGLMQL